MSSALLSIKASSDSSSAERQRLAERKRNILVLINQHLIENGYVEAAERLQAEAGGVLSKFTAADNIDLNLVMNEYEAYYEMRFDKRPKLARKITDGEESRVSNKTTSLNRRNSKDTNKSNARNEAAEGTKLPNVAGAVNSGGNATDPASDGAFGVSGMSIGGSSITNPTAPNAVSVAKFEERLLKPPPQFGGDPELRQLANTICRDIYQDSPNVRFDDIVELEEAKRLLIEAVHLPLRFPYLFTGILRPWRGILLHGPPGTGKTLLAKAVATECHTTFFNISASTLVSKWRGDSEKLVRVLFEVARYHAPSTIFLDEIDSILTSRDGEGGEHEASRRMKTELLIQLDGVKVDKYAGSNGDANSALPTESQVFVMAASNLPWDLDVAVLRRLEKRVLVPLPVPAAREAMFHKHLSDRSSDGVDFAQIAAATEGYSGADIELVCRESAMMPVRRLMKNIAQVDDPATSIPNPPPPHLQQPPAAAASGKGSRPAAAVAHANTMKPSAHTSNNNSSNSSDNRIRSAHVVSATAAASMQEINALLRQDPVTAEDILAALRTTKPSSDGNITKYEAWQRDYGSV